MEQYCDIFHQSFGLEYVCLRYFNVYGPRQDPASEYAAVIPIFISKALAGEDLTIHGDGTQTRDFVHVNDVVQANINAMMSEGCGIYNIAGGRSVTINELARKIIELTSSDSGAIHLDERSGDIDHSSANIHLASDRINFKPIMNLADGLNVTIEWASS